MKDDIICAGTEEVCVSDKQSDDVLLQKKQFRFSVLDHATGELRCFVTTWVDGYSQEQMMQHVLEAVQQGEAALWLHKQLGGRVH